jgi:hypothetical protein
MSFQYEYGHILGMKTTASEDLPYCRFVGIKDDKFVLAKEEIPLVGVTIPSVQDYKINSDGTTTKRESYYKDEQPQILHSGVCHIELEGAVTMGERIKLGSEGKAKKADVKNDVVLGIALDTQKEGFARIILKIK